MDSFSMASLNIKEIIETSSTEESNDFLKKGWHLLNSYTRDDYNVYVLGLPSISKSLEILESVNLD